LFPVEDPQHRSTVIYALQAMFRDNVKARNLDATGEYRRKAAVQGEPAFRVQQHLQDVAHRRAALTQSRAAVTFSPETAAR
jgi:polyphosphate kinase